MDLVHPHAHPLRHPPVRVFHRLGSRLGERERMVGLDLIVPVEAGQPVDHLAADVGAAGVLEMRPIPQVGVGEGREPAAGVRHV